MNRVSRGVRHAHGLGPLQRGGPDRHARAGAAAPAGSTVYVVMPAPGLLDFLRGRNWLLRRDGRRVTSLERRIDAIDRAMQLALNDQADGRAARVEVQTIDGTVESLQVLAAPR